jgi:radical SAM superfamily enzyme YgiQ (UPF0313 family)
MNILAINPRSKPNRQMKYVPIGLAYLLAVVERQGHEIDFFDMHNLGIGYDILEEKLQKQEYHVCLISAFATQVREITTLTELIKKVQRRCVVIIGGVGVSGIPEIALRYTGADAVSIGEAELTLPQILGSIEQGRGFEDTDGVFFRSGEQIVKRPRGPIPTNLDEIPDPAYHFFDIDYICRHSYNRSRNSDRSLMVLTSRGCSNQCRFCINSILNDRERFEQLYGKESSESFHLSLRYRAADRVVQEIRFLKSEYGINDIHFADEEFIGNRKRLKTMCEAIAPLNIKWSASCRADWADEDILAQMKGAGCQYVLFGVDSGSPTMLKAMNKRSNLVSAANGVQAARTLGLGVRINFLIGFPGETEETIKETIAFCTEHRMLYMPSYMTLYPNSAVFEENKENIKDWNEYFDVLATVDCTRKLFINLTDMPRRKLIALRNWGIAETWVTNVMPDLDGFVRRVSCAIVRRGVALTDYMPPIPRERMKDLVRRISDYRWIKG